MTFGKGLDGRSQARNRESTSHSRRMDDPPSATGETPRSSLFRGESFSSANFVLGRNYGSSGGAKRLVILFNELSLSSESEVNLLYRLLHEEVDDLPVP